MPVVVWDEEDSESSSEDEQEDHPCIAWSGLSKTIPVLLFVPEAVVSKDENISCVGERYNMGFKIVSTESRLVRGILLNHGFHEVAANSSDFNLMWTGSQLKPDALRSLQDFQKVNHFPRSYELTRKDRLYRNIQRMQQAHGFKNFHIIPQFFVLPSEYQEFYNCFTKDKGPWIIKPVASSRGQGIYLVSSPNQIRMDKTVLVSRYIDNPLLIDEFKFDMRLYVLVTSYDPLLVYVYEEGLARFATVKYDQTSKNIKNTFMHLTNYSVNKKSSDYVSCDDPEIEDYGNKWSMSAVLRYLKQEGKDTTLLMRQVEDLIIKAVVSAERQIATDCKTSVPHRTNCFELYGFDVLIDSNLKPWLLEVNLSPSLACDAPLDLKIKASMIADMFSLVGLVCQDPVLRQSDRGSLDRNSKHRPAHRTQNPFSATSGTAHTRVRQKPTSSNNSETVGLKEKHGVPPRNGDSSLSLTAEEIKVLRRITEEYERRGGFIRIFPTADTWELYCGYLKSKTSMNFMLAKRLFHGRNGNVQLQVDTVYSCHAVQYERKLLSLDERKRRQRHLTQRFSAEKKKFVMQLTSGKKSKASPKESGCAEGEECAQDEQEEAKPLLDSVQHKFLVTEQRKAAATALEHCHSHDVSSTVGSRPRVNLLNILHQGWDLSKVQARIAFSSYLRRVQQRLLAESGANTVPAWPDKDNDQMEQVVRFLRRAANVLQQDINVVLPSRQLPLQDRRRNLSHQLGEFIHCYNKETKHLVKRQESDREDHCVNSRVFQEYITAASENDLEEVLTFYAQKYKSATVFQGTKVRSIEKSSYEVNVFTDSYNCQNTGSLPVAKDDSSSSESSLSAVKHGSHRDVKPSDGQPSAYVQSEDQRAEARVCKTQPDVQGSQHCSSFPLTLEFPHTHLQHCCPASSSLPLHCPPPPPPSQTPQPPSYAQSLAKSHFFHSETLCDPPAYSSAPVITQPPRAPCTGSMNMEQATQVLRSLHSLSSSTSGSGTPSSIPSATLIYSQKLSRPTSGGPAFKRSSSSKLKSNSVGNFKELKALSAKAQSNQRAFISALQKLADKQAARQYASSSHINLLTHHLSSLNLAHRMLSRENLTLNPEADSAQRPVRAICSAADVSRSSSHRHDEESLWDGQMQKAYSLVKERYQSIQGSYPPQLSVQHLQHRTLPSQQSLERSHARRQAQHPDQTSVPHVQAPTQSSGISTPSFHVGSTHSHTHSRIHNCVKPPLAPKPPVGTREGHIRKTATKRLIKQASSESSASGGASSGQQVVQPVICGRAGLSAYSQLLRGQEPSHR